MKDSAVVSAGDFDEAVVSERDFDDAVVVSGGGAISSNAEDDMIVGGSASLHFAPAEVAADVAANARNVVVVVVVVAVG